jgi:hypothetical protein
LLEEWFTHLAARRDLGDFATGNYTPIDSQNTAIEVNEAILEESWL